VELHQIKKLLPSEGNNQQHEWEKIFGNYESGKQMISRKYKDLED
jgi:hypothetical protein